MNPIQDLRDGRAGHVKNRPQTIINKQRETSRAVCKEGYELKELRIPQSKVFGRRKVGHHRHEQQQTSSSIDGLPTTTAHSFIHSNTAEEFYHTLLTTSIVVTPSLFSKTIGRTFLRDSIHSFSRSNTLCYWSRYHWPPARGSSVRYCCRFRFIRWNAAQFCTLVCRIREAIGSCLLLDLTDLLPAPRLHQLAYPPQSTVLTT